MTDMDEPIGLPQPLVPAEVDLRDFRFLPLELSRLRRSRAWLIAKRRLDLGFYMLNLWAESWHEKPAASLEDDDEVLADKAMCDPQRWPEVRASALHGWVKCADGRLYHPVVAEKALEAWQRKQEQRERTRAATEARVRKRRARGAQRDEERDVHQGTGTGINGAAAPLEAAQGEKKSGAPLKRKRRPRNGNDNNLAALDAFTPTAERVERLRQKAPRVAGKLELLAEQFRTDPWWRKQFEVGEYSDPARCFENFVLRQESLAMDRGISPPKPPTRQPPQANGDPYSE